MGDIGIDFLRKYVEKFSDCAMKNRKLPKPPMVTPIDDPSSGESQCLEALDETLSPLIQANVPKKNIQEFHVSSYGTQDLHNTLKKCLVQI